MEHKFTKGKWSWLYGDREKLASLISDTGIEICNFGDAERYYPTEGEEPNEYDKLLISKAPEMLEMLDALVKNWDFINDSKHHNPDMEKARQLIKSATQL